MFAKNAHAERRGLIIFSQKEHVIARSRLKGGDVAISW